MSPLITDRDLLLTEPAVFIHAAAAGLVLAAANDGAVSGSTFTSASTDFETLGTTTGGVILVNNTPLEILDLSTSTELHISKPRSNKSGPAIEPGDGSDLAWSLITMQRIIERAQHRILTPILINQADPSLSLGAEAIVNTSDIARVIALRAAHEAFVIASALDPEDAALRALADAYGESAAIAREQTVAVVAVNGHEETRPLMAARMRRA